MFKVIGTLSPNEDQRIMIDAARYDAGFLPQKTGSFVPETCDITKELETVLRSFHLKPAENHATQYIEGYGFSHADLVVRNIQFQRPRIERRHLRTPIAEIVHCEQL